MERLTYRNGDRVGMIFNGCDGCNLMIINGILCHEQGCPDAWRDKDIDEDMDLQECG